MSTDRCGRTADVIQLGYAPSSDLAVKRDFLVSVHDLLKHRNCWCQQTIAVNVNDGVCDPAHPDAVRWCLLGAFDKVRDDMLLTRRGWGVSRDVFATELMGFKDVDDLTWWNDGHEHQEVVDYLAARISLFDNHVRASF